MSIRSARHGNGADDFAVFTFGDHLEGTAADFAIRGEPLAGNPRVNGHRKGLPAERALKVGEFFHGGNLTPPPENATRRFSGLP